LLIHEPRTCDVSGCDCQGFVAYSIQPGNHAAPPGPFEKMQLLASFVMPSSTQPPAADEAPVDPREDGIYFRGVTTETGDRDALCAVVENGQLISEQSLRVDEYSFSGIHVRHLPDFGPNAHVRSTWGLAHAFMRLTVPDASASAHIDVMSEFVRQLPPQWSFAGEELRRFLLAREFYKQALFAFREAINVDTVVYLARVQKPFPNEMFAPKVRTE
jgi:hypothetical protein